MPFFEFLNAHILDVFWWISIGIFGVATAIGFFRRDLMPRLASRLFLYSTGATFAYLIYIGYLQFEAFLSGPLGFFKPEGFLGFVTYTLSYLLLHYWNEYFYSFIAAILFALVAGFFNKKYHERFFEKEELYLIALGILLTGYPGFIFYIPLVLLASIIASALFVPRGERLPLYHLWMPVALATVLVIHFWAQNQVWWNSFKF